MWLIYAMLAAVFWGLTYSIAEKLYQNISVFTVLAISMSFGAILFFTLSYFKTLRTDLNTIITQPVILKWLLVEIVVIVIAHYCIACSIRGKNASFAAIIEIIYPLFTIFFTWLLFKENAIQPSTLIGGLFILLGVFIVSY